jgi:glycosyltransferase involved in cell wall biosynthesis
MKQRATPKPRIGIFIVAYNAETTLSRVLDRIPADLRSRVEEIFVFDDASQDSTYLLAHGYHAVHGWPNLKIFRNASNQGYGGNQKLGYRYAMERGLDYVVLLHGDGQYAPEELPRMLEPLLAGRADAVFGSRMMVPGAARQGGMPLYKRIGNRILTRLQNGLAGASLSEWHSGYRAYRVDALRELALDRNSDDFHFDTEIILELLDAGFRIEEVPIPVYYGDEICYVNGMKYARDAVRATLDYRRHASGLRADPRFRHPERYPHKTLRYSSHQQIARMLPVGARVLDVGCEPAVARAYGERGCRVTGVGEPHNVVHAGELNGYYARDLEHGIHLPPAAGRFDVVLLADVIEHCRSGSELLGEAMRYLAPGGRVIISTGNVAFLSVRLGLLFGRFAYTPRGILDETHVRLYTRRTFLDTIRQAGLTPIRVGVAPPPLEAVFPRSADSPVMAAADAVLYGLARFWNGLFAFQFIVEAVPTLRPAAVPLSKLLNDAARGDPACRKSRVDEDVKDRPRPSPD